MTDGDETDDIAEIRERKLEALRAQIDGDGQSADVAVPDEPVSIDDPDHLSELLEDHSLVVVDFYADWCGPCQMLAPMLERVAGDVPAVIAKVDTEALPTLAQQYGVRGLPTLILFEDGKPAEQLVGMQEESRLRQVIDRHASA